jgi:hypothetical protein
MDDDFSAREARDARVSENRTSGKKRTMEYNRRRGVLGTNSSSSEDSDSEEYSGSAKPMPSTFLEGAKASYMNPPPQKIAEGFQIVFNTPTLDAYINETTKTILVCVRGTQPTDKQDLYADASIVLNRLSKTPRYMADKESIGRLIQMFSPTEYEYYLTGHSLGGAIINLLKRDFPPFKDAEEYNPAYQPYDLWSQQTGSIHRNYVSTDPLYRLGGRFFGNTKVVPPNKTTLPTGNLVGELYNSYKGHALDNFAGAGKVVKMPEGQYLAEHAHLLNVLAHPTPTKLKREYRKQKKEVDEYKA